MNKKTFFIFVSILLCGLGAAVCFISFKDKSQNYYVSSGCDILSRDGKALLYKVNYQYCHFLNDGGLLAYNAGTRMV